MFSTDEALEELELDELELDELEELDEDDDELDVTAVFGYNTASQYLSIAENTA
jgi:hypothetical protein